MTWDRYDRQRRLAEVGADGQARIEAWTARIPSGPAAQVALLYLVRAGVGRASVEAGGESAFAHHDWFRFDSSRVVAEGAHHALLELKRALSKEKAAG